MRRLGMFQFSIGDAAGGRGGGGRPGNRTFQFSIGDAGARRVTYATSSTSFNSLLEMHVSTPNMRRVYRGDSFNSLLEMHSCSRRTVARHSEFQFSIGDAGSRWWLRCLSGATTFQFSIGDAGSCGVLDVWVFKFFVCVLARWRLAGLCGLLCLVYR